MAFSKLFNVVVIACLSGCQQGNSVISVSYQDGGNLQKGDKVILNGFAVGEVIALHFVPKKVLVDLTIEEGAKIPLNSQFIVNQSFLGSASIIIKPSRNARFITNTDTVVGVSYKAPVLDSVKQKKAHAGLKKIEQGLSEVFQSLGTDSASNIK